MSEMKFYPIEHNAVNEAVKQFGYGDIIPKEWLLSQLEINYPESATPEGFAKLQFEYLELVEAFKEIMLEQHKMFLHNVRGKGYLIVQPEEQTQKVMTVLRGKINKLLEQSAYRLSYIRYDLLTHEQRQENENAKMKLATLAVFSRDKLLRAEEKRALLDMN